jgi:hypothetical protein
LMSFINSLLVNAFHSFSDKMPINVWIAQSRFVKFLNYDFAADTEDIQTFQWNNRWDF